MWQIIVVIMQEYCLYFFSLSLEVAIQKNIIKQSGYFHHDAAIVVSYYYNEIVNIRKEMSVECNIFISKDVP
jgi:hypothetical protein